MELNAYLFLLLGFSASIISAVFGFGTALIVLILGAHILPVKETIALATVLFATSTLLKTILLFRHIDWKVAGLMAMGSLPFAYLGALLLVNVPVEMLKRMLAVMVLIYLFLSVVNRFPKIKVGIVGLIAGSAAYGFVSGLLGSGNLIKVVVFREMKMTKEVFVSTMAATSVFSNVAKLTAYTKSGLLNESKLWFILSLVVASIGAVLIGQRILRNISVCFFEIGMRIVLAASAIALLI